MVGEHSIAGVLAFLYNLTKSVQDPLFKLFFIIFGNIYLNTVLFDV